MGAYSGLGFLTDSFRGFMTLSIGRSGRGDTLGILVSAGLGFKSSYLRFGVLDLGFRKYSLGFSKTRGLLLQVPRI